jgi:hypothetical protein
VISVLGAMWVLQGLAVGVIVMHPYWREGLIVRVGLVAIGLGSVPLGIELLSQGEPSVRALVHAAFVQAVGWQLLVFGWVWRSWRRGAPQRRHTDWGGLDGEAPALDRRGGT